MRLTLEALAVLDAIDRKGSFAAAADALYTVQSNVSYTVKKLESDIGVLLFHKQGRRSVLTPAGKVLLEQGRGLLKAAEQAVENTREAATGWESRLAIAVDSVLSVSAYYPMIEAFTAQHPTVDIHLYEEVLGGTLEALIHDKVQLAVGLVEKPRQQPQIEVITVGQIEWVFAVASHHPLAHKAYVEPSDIAPYRAAVVRDSSQQLPPMSTRVFGAQAQLTVPTIHEKIQAQCSGCAVGFLPAHRIKGYLENGDLVAIPFEYETMQSPLYMAWHKNNRGKARRWFADKISALDDVKGLNTRQADLT